MAVTPSAEVGADPIRPNRHVLRQVGYYRYRCLLIAERGDRSI